MSLGSWPEERVADPCRRLEGRSEAEQASLQRLDQVLDQMPTIGHLDRLRRTFPGGLRIRRSAITADDLDAGMLPEPGATRLGLAILEQLDDPSLLEVDQDGAVAMAFAEGPVVRKRRPRSRSRAFCGEWASISRRPTIYRRGP